MYGEYVAHMSQKNDKYGFVNEVEIRISAGISLVFALFALFLVLFKAEYMIPLVIISIVWTDFVIKVFINPKYSLFWNIVRLFIKKSPKIYVWAIQKRFAWIIWLIISTLVLFCLIVQSWILLDWWFTYKELIEIQKFTLERQNLSSIMITPFSPPILLCVLCIVFMWLESVVGYCVWCNIYTFLVKKWIMKKYEWQNCLNGQCEI